MHLITHSNPYIHSTTVLCDIAMDLHLLQMELHRITKTTIIIELNRLSLMEKERLEDTKSK